MTHPQPYAATHGLYITCIDMRSSPDSLTGFHVYSSPLPQATVSMDRESTAGGDAQEIRLQRWFGFPSEGSIKPSIDASRVHLARDTFPSTKNSSKNRPMPIRIASHLSLSYKYLPMVMLRTHCPQATAKHAKSTR